MTDCEVSSIVGSILVFHTLLHLKRSLGVSYVYQSGWCLVAQSQLMFNPDQLAKQAAWYANSSQFLWLGFFVTMRFRRRPAGVWQCEQMQLQT